MRAKSVDRFQRAGQYKAEVFVGQAQRNGKPRWRWDLTYYTIAEVDTSQRELMGVNGRYHMGGDVGYTRTWLGAWLAVARAYRRYPKAIV